MPHLRTVGRKASHGDETAFPFTVEAIRTLPTLELDAAVTLLVGENGSGKSTLLEALAAAASLPTVGSEEAGADETLEAQRRLARALKLTWSRRTRRGFFLRAEDFFGYQKRLARLQREMRVRLEEVDSTYEGRSELARQLARGPAAASLADMARRYGDDPDARSHGEAFLNLFQSRFVPGGLYLLDEPEAALSPQSQLGLLAILFEMVKQKAQFVIASHSPILLAYPDATIYSFDHVPVACLSYEELAHVRLTRDFLTDPASYLRRLQDGS